MTADVYQGKLVSAEEAISSIRSGEVIVWSWLAEPVGPREGGHLRRAP